MEAMGAKVVDRLVLRGDEKVLDAGCGTGRVTALLLERLPSGRVIALDADGSMVTKAREFLAGYADRVDVRQGDLLALDLIDEVDAVLSTATFHWVLDHDLLFANLFRAIRPGGWLIAQCGGAGNLSAILGAADEVAADARWSSRFAGWTRPSNMAGPDETAARLIAAGFTDVRCWLESSPQQPEDPAGYLATINLGAHLERIDAGDRQAFVSQVLERLPSPVTVDYVRLNVDARVPA